MATDAVNADQIALCQLLDLRDRIQYLLKELTGTLQRRRGRQYQGATSGVDENSVLMLKSKPIHW
jgi:hypothetical protein